MTSAAAAITAAGPASGGIIPPTGRWPREKEPEERAGERAARRIAGHEPGQGPGNQGMRELELGDGHLLDGDARPRAPIQPIQTVHGIDGASPSTYGSRSSSEPRSTAARRGTSWATSATPRARSAASAVRSAAPR